jgi:hypothetical protein
MVLLAQSILFLLTIPQVDRLVVVFLIFFFNNILKNFLISKVETSSPDRFHRSEKNSLISLVP